MNRNLGEQFRFVTRPRGDSKVIELHRGGTPLGYAQIEHSDGHTYVSYLKSHQEGQGHARRIMEHVYNKYSGPVDWGHTTSPAATHLAESFESHPEYGSRTYHDGEM
jgi:hypothetical protein